MKLLYSDILPLGISEGQRTFADCFRDQMENADRVEIAVGYISYASLIELERLTEASGINSICLNIGMYFIEGMPERSYHVAMRLNEKWIEQNAGEIRVVKAFKYHGKIYCFYRDSKPFSAIIGSANLGAVKLEASRRNCYGNCKTSSGTEGPKLFRKYCGYYPYAADPRDQHVFERYRTRYAGPKIQC